MVVDTVLEGGACNEARVAREESGKSSGGDPTDSFLRSRISVTKRRWQEKSSELKTRQGLTKATDQQKAEEPTVKE